MMTGYFAGSQYSYKEEKIVKNISIDKQKIKRQAKLGG